MTDHWELLDTVKAGLAFIAGMLLGLERELKDKAAGLKTITIICLGATLFSIISYKIGGTENTRIAAYIVSGVGFLGAGVIFKDGFTISGLTTAGIVWLAAAIGTSIGFGEFFLAATFLGFALVLIISGSHINRLLKAKKESRYLEFEIDRKNIREKLVIFSELSREDILIEEKKVEFNGERIKVIAEVTLGHPKVGWLQEYLLQNELIRSFSF